jgi:hypothetical protein
VIGSNVRTNKGDIFCVSVNGKSRYFQYIDDDKSQLGSNVICAFKGEFSSHSHPNLGELQTTGVDFYAHVLLKAGEKMKIWSKQQTSLEICPVADVWFRDVADSGNLSPGITENWILWRVNQPRFRVDAKRHELFASHIGIVNSSIQVCQR